MGPKEGFLHTLEQNRSPSFCDNARAPGFQTLNRVAREITEAIEARNILATGPLTGMNARWRRPVSEL